MIAYLSIRHTYQIGLLTYVEGLNKVAGGKEVIIQLSNILDGMQTTFVHSRCLVVVQ